MKLSDQAAGALLMALQKCLWEETDIMPLLKQMDFEPSGDGLTVINPPVVSGDLEELASREARLQDLAAREAGDHASPECGGMNEES
jgi:hypothetical protein